MTNIWLGTSWAPTALGGIAFCMVVPSQRAVGAALVNMVNDAVVYRVAPMMRCETTPPSVPASSPLESKVSLFMVIVIPPRHITFAEAVAGLQVVVILMFGSGIGTGPAGVGILQTSGKPRLMPMRFVLTGNMFLPHVDGAAVNGIFFFTAHARAFSVLNIRAVDFDMALFASA